ncbi:MAG: GIY-YIG nuclease family protein [Gammaproteobacteria bacterium]|nr:GIY-YIG nuclease family protein [Gammaproteobacteria bacterium]
MDRQPAVYILASKRNGTLYIGVTSDLRKRIWEHNRDLVEGFTKRYHIHRLVWYELHGDMSSAITREKQLKKWNREWKLQLIELGNSQWKDLWSEII